MFTKEEIEKLEPGRELDRLVAVGVMEWQIFKTTKEWAEAGEPLGFEISVLDQEPRFEPPAYSTDIAAAWLVAQKLVSLEGIDNGIVDAFHHAMSTACRRTPLYEYSSADAAAIICRAALLAAKGGAG